LGFDACFPDSIVGFRADLSHCNIRYVEYFLRTIKDDLERYAPATAQKNINLKILSEVAIPYPPLEEQNVFVDKVERRMSVADEIEGELEQALLRADRLRQSILTCAFEGKLVQQCPEDGDARKLLEQITGIV
jgi:type I restriction enzyme S subunit